MEELQSPFMFGTTVASEDFVNRKDDINHLWLNVKSGINTAVISPRRWGKSSLVKQAALLTSSDKRVKWCFLDMFAIRNEEEFYEKLSREIIKITATKWEEWIESAKIFFKHLVPKITLGADPVHNFSLSFELEELKKHKDEILNLPETVAKKQNVRLVVCIDEFQNIHGFKEAEAFEKLLRSAWQHHENVSYCLYGSKRHLMSDIFNRRNRAFYLFGDMMLLDKIAIEHWEPFIVERFRKTGKTISKAMANQIATTMKGHPYYVQQYAHYVWEYTTTTATEALLPICLARMLEVNQILYQREIEDLTTTQINLLEAITNEETQFTSVKTMTDYRLGTPHNVSKNMKKMQYLDIIEKTKTKTIFLDPAFELWFKMYYLKS
jgi:AAA+ ATPase superfamily predicted ATPase